VGCSVGRVLTTHYSQYCTCFGADIDQESLVKARQTNPKLHLGRAMGESLPFAPASFDMVMSVLRFLTCTSRRPLPNSRACCGLAASSTCRFTRRHPVGHVPESELGRKVYFLYAIFNGLLFHFTQMMFRFPNGRCESFQTERSTTTVLTRRGFANRVPADQQAFPGRGAPPGAAKNSLKTPPFETAGAALGILDCQVLN